MSGRTQGIERWKDTFILQYGISITGVSFLKYPTYFDATIMEVSFGIIF